MNLQTVKNTVLAVVAAVGGVVAQALGGWDTLLKVLVGLMAADYICGLLIAAIWHKSNKSDTGALDSKASFKGLVRKCMIFLLIYIGVLLDKAIGTEYIRAAVIIFYIGNEGLSVLENLCIMGVPHPAFLAKVLEALKEKGDSGGADNK